MLPISYLAGIINENGSLPSVATLGGLSSVSALSPHSDVVTLDHPADKVYTVTWFRSDGATGPATSTIAVGQISVTGSSTWASAGAGRTVDFSISPPLIMTGGPLSVSVLSASGVGAPTQIEQSGYDDWTTNTPALVTYFLNAPADQPYVVTPIVTGGAVIGSSSQTIPIGLRRLTFNIQRTTEGQVSIDFTVSPSLTKIGSSLTTYFTHYPETVGLTEEVLDLSRVVFPEPWCYGGGAYMRAMSLVIWSNSVESMRAVRLDMSGAVNPNNYTPAKSYDLLIDDVVVATTSASEGDRIFVFNSISTAGISHGWHRMKIGNLSNGETGPSLFFFMRITGLPMPKMIPICSSTYDIEQRGMGDPHGYGPEIQTYAFIPAAYAPKPVPLPPRTYQEFSDAYTGGFTAVPITAFDRYVPVTPNISTAGVVSTFNKMGYYWSDFIEKYPIINLLDGPRGVGTIAMTAHIMFADAKQRAADATPLRHLYALDPWRMVRVADDGEIKTLVGYRHKKIASNFQEVPRKPDTSPSPQQTLELVGDWSAIPVERRGFHELWSMIWMPSTVTVSTSLPLIMDENGTMREQHTLGPSALLTDTQNNRIVRATFKATDRGADPVVTEWLTGMQDPWGIAWWENPTTQQYEILISERAAHRIVAYDERGIFSEQ